ncbi:1953_t:CDS:2, partial [Acaulospora morrowiae]
MDLESVQQFDDVLTDLLLDKLFLWFRTFKLNPGYRETNISRGNIIDLVTRYVITTNKLNEAVRELLRIPTVRETAGITEETEKDFIMHAKRYLMMYLPNAGYEIAETSRYLGSSKREACIIATKPWHIGDEIKYCTGTLVHLTTEEEKALEGGRDFSHDCRPNTEFISAGQNAISFKFIQDVNIGEEITAYYGDNYFGTGNAECLCATCERNQTGSFRTAGTAEEDPVIEGLRPFVYDDTGKLVRRSLRRNLATNSFRSRPLRKSGKSKKQPTIEISNTAIEGECSTHSSSEDPMAIDIDEQEDNADDQATSILSDYAPSHSSYADDCAASSNLSIPDENASTTEFNA